MITVTAWINGEQCAAFLDYLTASEEVFYAVEAGDNTITVDNTGTLIINADGDHFHYAGIYADIPGDVASLVPADTQGMTQAQLIAAEHARMDAERAAWEASRPDYDALAWERIAAGYEPF